MSLIVIDTCIIIHILRGRAEGTNSLSYIDTYDNAVISSVTKGELESLKKFSNWGTSRTTALDSLLQRIIHIDINSSDSQLFQSYSTLDAFSKRKIPDGTGNLLSGSAIKMGKNDLWIAATAHRLDAPLITTDKDFDHLNGLFLQIINPLITP